MFEAKLAKKGAIEIPCSPSFGYEIQEFRVVRQLLIIACQ